MSAPLVVVTGTGTEIGKTHVSASLLGAWRRARPDAQILGLKPIESGGTEDGDTLGRMSTFHVKRFPAPYLLERPVSPHLAARAEGRTIEPGPVVELVQDARARVEGLLVELPGGLFSPLAEGFTNEDLVHRLAPSFTVLVAPDRLGVLHDVIATLRATSWTIDVVVLSSPASPDASTGTNAAELARFVDVPVAGVLPRAPVEALVEHPLLAALVERLDPTVRAA